MIASVILLDMLGINSFRPNFIDVESFWQLFIRFTFNLLILILLVRGIYYRERKRKDFLFSYFSISTIVFFLCILLESVKLELGFALGLFAIFGIIRYRTKVIPIREMTYLFVIIGISVINALASMEISYAELLFTNMAVLLLLYTLERLNYRLDDDSVKKMILHEKIDTIDLSDEPALIEFLTLKTGLKVIRYSLGRIDYNTQTVEIAVYYQPE